MVAATAPQGLLMKQIVVLRHTYIAATRPSGPLMVRHHKLYEIDKRVPIQFNLLCYLELILCFSHRGTPTKEILQAVVELHNRFVVNF